MTISNEILVNCNQVAKRTSELARQFLDENNLVSQGVVVPIVQFVDTEETRNTLNLLSSGAGLDAFVISYNEVDLSDQIAQVHPSVLERNLAAFGVANPENYQNAVIEETILIIKSLTLVEDNSSALTDLSRYIIDKLIS